VCWFQHRVGLKQKFGLTLSVLEIGIFIRATMPTGAVTKGEGAASPTKGSHYTGEE
jgi:hypothetical protein